MDKSVEMAQMEIERAAIIAKIKDIDNQIISVHNREIDESDTNRIELAEHEKEDQIIGLYQTKDTFLVDLNKIDMAMTMLLVGGM